MKSQLVIKLEGWISFLIPFLSAVGGSALLADTFWGKCVTMLCLSLVAGLSGLKTFFSTTYGDSLPDVPKPTITSGQFYVPPIEHPVFVPNPQPAAEPAIKP